MKIVLLLCIVALVWSCNKHDGVDPTPIPSLKGSISVDKTTLNYNGISYDSTVTVTWSSHGAVSATLNGESVGTSGSKKITLFKTTTFTFAVSDGKSTVTDEKSVTVTIDPTLALLGSGWVRMVRDQYLDSSGWHDYKIPDLSSDNRIKYLPNRMELFDSGTKLEHGEQRYGFSTDTVFAVYSQKQILRTVQPIEWTIKSLTASGMVWEGYVPGLFGSPPQYTRQTFVIEQ